MISNTFFFLLFSYLFTIQEEHHKENVIPQRYLVVSLPFYFPAFFTSFDYSSFTLQSFILFLFFFPLKYFVLLTILLLFRVLLQDEHHKGMLKMLFIAQLFMLSSYFLYSYFHFKIFHCLMIVIYFARNHVVISNKFFLLPSTIWLQVKEIKQCLAKMLGQLSILFSFYSLSSFMYFVQ